MVRFSKAWPEQRARKGIRTIHGGWVRCVKVGQFNVSELTERGRAILEGDVPVSVRGYGPYRELWKRWPLGCDED